MVAIEHALQEVRHMLKYIGLRRRRRKHMIKRKVMRLDGRRAHRTLGRRPHLELRRELLCIRIAQIYARTLVPGGPHTRVHTHIATQLLDLVVQATTQHLGVSKPRFEEVHAFSRSGRLGRKRSGACICGGKQRLKLRHARSQRVF